ncbi:sensor histidine kinase [Paenibacillus koleovorans]|uniref:sensor histidine kinase n=1 Tax=Paenibacillus koleovorans TaxID=121608 RepID=UPI0013E3A003|nr:ATP-binding protein [Paenibacillus koleovorans]
MNNWIRAVGWKGLLAALVLSQLWFLHIFVHHPAGGIIVTDLEQGSDQADTTVLLRGNELMEVSTAGVHNAMRYDVFAIGGGIACFAFAALLFRRMRHSVSARYLVFLFLTIGITFMSLVASIRGDALGKHLVSSALVALPVLFLHLLFVFLKEKANLTLSFRFIRLLAWVTAISFVARFTYFMDDDLARFVHRIDSVFALLMLVISLAYCFGMLFRLYVRHRKETSYASMLIRTIWVSLLLSFAPLVILSFIPMLLDFSPILDPLYSSWFLLFSPLSFAYLIVTRQLFDLGLVFRRILLTVMIAALPSAGMTLITRILAPNDMTPSRLAIEFLLFLLVLSCILYSLEYFTTKLEPTMFPRKHYLQKALRTIARSLGSVSSFRQLKDLFLVDIVHSLQVFGGAIVFQYKDSLEIIHEGVIEEQEVRRLVRKGESESDSFTILEITRHEEFTSYLVMTPKRTNTKLGLEERQWLNLIITYLSVSLENIHLMRKLTERLEQLAGQMPSEQTAVDLVWFRKLMFELQEKERVRIAADLHDTTMQDLFFLKGRLQSILEHFPFTGSELQQIRSMIDYIDVIHSNLRQSCFELHPYLLKEIGLVPTLEKLVRLEKAIAPFDIEFYTVQPAIIERTDLETKRHLFRIAQELINNAKKHSDASRIRLSLRGSHAQIILDYEDDGIGYEPGHQTVTQEIGSSGIGMAQMKSRILSLNGQYELETSRGNGYKFRATFPLGEVQTA